MIVRLAALVLGLALLAARPAAALPVTTAAGSNPTIVVGFIATLSGPGAMAGQDYVDGFTTALRQMGGRFANQEVRVVAVDDRGSPDAALQATRKLLERERVDFVLTAVSQSSMAAIVKPLLDSKLFVLNLDAAPASLQGAECNSMLFQVGTPPEAVAEASGLFFATERYRKVVVVGPDSPAPAAAIAGIRRYWSDEIAAVLKTRHGAVTFRDELARIKELAPDAVYSVLSGGMGVAFAREYAQSGLKGDIPLITPWSSLERPLLPGMGEFGLDLLSVAPWSPDLDIALNKRMVADFELEFGRPATAWVAQGYDAAMLLEAAMKTTSGRTNDREAVRHGLRRAEFSSVRGVFRFDTNHAPVLSVYLRRVVKDSKGRLTHETRAPLIKEWRGRDVLQCPMRWTEEPTPPKPGAAPAPGQPAQAQPKPPRKPPAH